MAVFGPRGGSGKATLAVNMATLLARTFATVLEETKNQQVRELCLLLLGKTAPAQAAVGLVEFVTSSEQDLADAFSDE